MLAGYVMVVILLLFKFWLKIRISRRQSLKRSSWFDKLFHLDFYQFFPYPNFYFFLLYTLCYLPMNKYCIHKPTGAGLYTNCNRQFEGGRGAWDRVTKGHELDEGTASVSRSAGSVRPPQQFSSQDNLCLSFFLLFFLFLCFDTVTLRPTISGFLSFISSCWKLFCNVEVPLLHLFTGTDNIFLSFFFYYSPNFSSLRVSISWSCLWPRLSSVSV
jgi:hypothetical protein